MYHYDKNDWKSVRCIAKKFGAKYKIYSNQMSTKMANSIVPQPTPSDNYKTNMFISQYHFPTNYLGTRNWIYKQTIRGVSFWCQSI